MPRLSIASLVPVQPVVVATIANKNGAQVLLDATGSLRTGEELIECAERVGVIGGNRRRLGIAGRHRRIHRRATKTSNT